MDEVAPHRRLFLGIEGGATRSIALLADDSARLVDQVQLGPANARLLTDSALAELLQSVASVTSPPNAVCLALAGIRTDHDRTRVERIAGQVFPRIPCYVCNDLESALAAASDSKSAETLHSTRVRTRTNHFDARILILSGTGSCCFGIDSAGKQVKIGGWGHLLGDRGSGYEVALAALRETVAQFDRNGKWSRAGQRYLRALQLNEPNDLIDWLQAASKRDVAALAPEVFAAAGFDPIACEISNGAAEALAADGLRCAMRLARRHEPVEFLLAGGILVKQPDFARHVARILRSGWPAARVRVLKVESAWGAVRLAQKHFHEVKRSSSAAGKQARERPSVRSGQPLRVTAAQELPPTEQQNPGSTRFSRLNISQAVDLMLQEEASVHAALGKVRPAIERAIHSIVRSLRRGGRLFYAGAGTSGRLGVLDASECPPTFGTHPDLVQGIIAGGQAALWKSIEGAEDDASAGSRAIRFRGVTSKDVVVGIAAGGRTPFVLGALGMAQAVRATTVLICFNPNVKFLDRRPHVVIAPDTGPEVLTGSTRLKAGTATKLILNTISTISMARLGKVRGNLMIDLNPANTKLRNRAVRIVEALTGADSDEAAAALAQAGWIVKAAVAGIKKRHSRPQVKRLLGKGRSA